MLVLAGFVLLSVLLYGRGALGDPQHLVVGSGQKPEFFGRDQSLIVWALAWPGHVLRTGAAPLHTSLIFAPGGFNLAWMTGLAAPGVVLLPVTLLAGPVVSYDVLALLAPACAAWTAFGLCRWLTGALAPALVGGLLFGFSSYESAETINHPHLALTALLPLAVLLVVRRVQGDLSRRRFVLGLGLVLALQLYTSTELFATMVLFGTVALGLAVALAPSGQRGPLVRAARDAAPALGVALGLGVPYLLTALTGGDPLYRSSADAGIDVANLVVPTKATWLHGPTGNRTAMVALTINLTEQLAYFGLPLLLGFIVIAWRRRRSFAWRLLGVFALVALACSLGGVLAIAGHKTVPLPWALVAHVPLLEHAIPARFVLLVWLAVAVGVALWVAEAGRSGPRWALVAVSLALLAPNMTSLPWSTRLDAPPLVARGLPGIARGDTVLALPFGVKTESMYWQARADFRFRLAGGYASWAVPASYRRFSILPELSGAQPRHDAPARLRAFLAATRTTVILLRDDRPGGWSRLLAGIRRRPVHAGGFTLYRIAAPRP